LRDFGRGQKYEYKKSKLLSRQIFIYLNGFRAPSLMPVTLSV
jgi:hypothetical protein